MNHKYMNINILKHKFDEDHEGIPETLTLEKDKPDFDLTLLTANLCALVCDYVARQKIQSRNLNKYILEQLPVITRAAYDRQRTGRRSSSAVSETATRPAAAMVAVGGSNIWASVPASRLPAGKNPHVTM